MCKSKCYYCGKDITEIANSVEISNTLYCDVACLTLSGQCPRRKCHV